MRDEELIQSILQGDGEKYAVIVDRYQTRLYRTAYYYAGNVEDARDLTQEILIKAYNSLAKFKHGSAFSTWLYRIAVNHCIDWSRKKRPRCEEATCLLNLSDGEAGPEERFLRQERAAEVHRAVGCLPERYSTVLMLYYFEEWTPQEIAFILAISKRTVETRLSRGRKMLREKIPLKQAGGVCHDLFSQSG
ncbi:RNA polymerase sigma factor, sigma-70 family [Acididesulfobacillus acetoxydans]|uniref:RNA polymerase sigma factor, sigma-70 n=1 Tax=Acididesulfobacillus acetoxydans TaxID=1561005 RepID=A0A8S0WQK1_9FIRM|nr:sigma-70 family RNA polymerase sigma factor [Acididesulfobacillus acetoxydans]CAA7602674.1 RNA polymerase sigma factor, sigma-70 family [Acididesulfobacillus acetoxydans]CEJ09147.1 RNA polymerase sigma factor, sigma-70 [Acididesulfobacillus acetoxydans]